MKLSIGLLKPDVHWTHWLLQSGIPFDIAGDSAQQLADFPAIVINDTALFHPAKIQKYVTDGGCAICEASVAETIFVVPTRRLKITHLQPANDIFFNHLPAVQLPLNSRVATSANALTNQNGTFTTAVLPFGDGKIVIFPDGFAAASATFRTCRVNFPRYGGERFPSERVCAVDKSGLRKIVFSAIVQLFAHRKLPLVFCWPFADGATSRFSFRIDTDFAHPNEITALHDLLKKHNISATWFVETRSAQNHIDLFAKMTNQEIALHCFRHAIFDTTGENARDIRRGLNILQHAGIRPKGFAAPFGEWHPQLAAAISGQQFGYSSEFAPGYDDLPSWPAIGDGFSETLQIPVHPVSTGRLHWAKHSPAQMIDYYRATIDRQVAANDPVILYHHPGQKNLVVFDSIFEYIRAKKIPAGTMAEFAEWWQFRDQLNWRADWLDNKLNLAVEHPSEKARLAVIFPGEKCRLFQFADQIIDDTTDAVQRDYQQSVTQNAPGEQHKYTAQMLVHDITWRYSRWKQIRKAKSNE